MEHLQTARAHDVDSEHTQCRVRGRLARRFVDKVGAPGEALGDHDVVPMVPWSTPGPALEPADAVSVLRHSSANRFYNHGDQVTAITRTLYIALRSPAGSVVVLGLLGTDTEVALN